MNSGPPTDNEINQDEQHEYDHKEIGRKIITEAFEQAATGRDQPNTVGDIVQEAQRNAAKQSELEELAAGAQLQAKQQQSNMYQNFMMLQYNNQYMQKQFCVKN